VRLHLCKQVVARERPIADWLARCRQNRAAKRAAIERALFSIQFELTIGSPSSIQARSEASRLGHKLIAYTVYGEKVRRVRRVALQFLS
jgi:hypothetical protein